MVKKLTRFPIIKFGHILYQIVHYQIWDSDSTRQNISARSHKNGHFTGFAYQMDSESSVIVDEIWLKIVV